MTYPISSQTFQKTISLLTIGAILFAYAFSAYASGNTNSINLVAASSQYTSRTAPLTGFPTGGAQKTIEAWIKPVSLPTTGGLAYIVDMGTDLFPTSHEGDNGEFNLAVKEVGGHYVGYEDVYNRAVEGTVDLGLVLNVWQHYAVVYDGTNFTWYVNGIQKDSQLAGTVNSVIDAAGIGARVINPISYGGFYDGGVDDVRIWNVGRTASQIAANYTHELAPQTGLAAYWKLNGDDSDSSGSGNTLTRTGGAAFSPDVPFNDTTSPTVSVTNPTEGQSVSNTIVLSANATDNTAVAGVQFLVDGSAFGAEDTVTPYSINLDTTTIAAGAHTIAARARDTSGNVATSTAVNITVVPPFVPILKARQVISVSGTGAALRNDPQLTLQLDGGKTYIIDGTILASATGATPDIKIAFSGTPVVSFDLGYEEAGINGVLTTLGMASVSLPLPANTPRSIRVTGTIATASSGPLTLQWAQNASSTQVTTVRAGSYLRADQLP